MRAGVAHEQRLLSSWQGEEKMVREFLRLLSRGLSSPLVCVLVSVISTISFIRRILIRCVVYVKFVVLQVSCEH
jgi:hypothetical protein